MDPNAGGWEPPAPGSPAEVQQSAGALGGILLLFLTPGVPCSLGSAGAAPRDALGQGGAGYVLQAPRLRAGVVRWVWGRREAFGDTVAWGRTSWEGLARHGAGWKLGQKIGLGSRAGDLQRSGLRHQHLPKEGSDPVTVLSTHPRVLGCPRGVFL